MNNIQIKRISVIDLEDLQIISKQTFFETFANENSESDMKNYLDENLKAQIHYEHSTFKLENGKWFYVDGEY